MPVTFVSTLGPSPIKVAPLIESPSLPFSILYASVQLKTNLPDTMSTCPPPKLLAKMPFLTRPSSSAGSSLPPRMKVLVIRGIGRSEEHTSELQSLMRISYAVFCLKKKHKQHNQPKHRSDRSH